MYIVKKEGIALVEALILLAIIIVMISVYGNLISNNINKGYIYNNTESIRRLSEEETILLERVNEDINSNEELLNQFLEYEKDTTLNITYTLKSSSNENLIFEYKDSKLYMCNYYNKRKVTMREIDIKSKDNKIYLEPMFYKITLYLD